MTRNECLKQFEGATIESFKDYGERAVVLVIRLPNGAARDLVVYEAHDSPLAVRVDGMYVPYE